MPGDLHGDLLAARPDFPILERCTYLANHTLGAMHRGTPERLASFTALWATRGVLAWEDWAPEMGRAADLVAAVIGAPAGSVVLRQNVADALGALLSAVEFGPARDRIVYADEVEWPGSHYLFTRHAAYGATACPVPAALPGGLGVDTERLAAAIDERTALVYLSAVLFRTGALVDAAPVVERARQVGALVVLDAYQAAGAVPLEVAASGVDACVGGSVKYLCGGPGAGWMYVRPETAAALRPAVVGWFGHAEPFAFDFGEYREAPGVARFTGGTPGVPAAYAAAAGYQAVLDAGIGRIRERSMSLTQPLVEAVLERGWELHSPADAERRGGHVAFDPGRAEAVCAGLAERGVIVDARPGVGLRAAPHFFSTADECALLVEQVAAVRSELGR